MLMLCCLCIGSPGVHREGELVCTLGELGGLLSAQPGGGDQAGLPSGGTYVSKE